MKQPIVCKHMRKLQKYQKAYLPTRTIKKRKYNYLLLQLSNVTPQATSVMISTIATITVKIIQ